MPPIGALGFSPDGTQLWTATHGSIEIRSWPELSLLHAVPWTRPVVRVHHDGLPAENRQALAFHPAGRIAALAYRSSVFLLDREGRPLPRLDRVLRGGVYGITFEEDGRVVAANTSGVFALGPEGEPQPLGVPPNGPLPTWVWRAAVAPWAKTVVYCVNDQASLFYSWETGEVRTQDEWGGIGDADESSWLAVDLAPGGRAMACGTKNGETWIVGLGPRLEPTSLHDVHKANVRRPDKLKLPMRTTAHAIHPTEDALVFAEISGFVFHAKLSTGEIVRELPRAGAGYAWE